MTDTIATPSTAGRPSYNVAATYGNPRSISYRFRAARFATLRPLIDRIIARQGRARIVDIGGTEYYWQIFGDYLASMPIEIDLINLTHTPTTSPKLTSIVADATRLDHVDDNSYDLVHSNSVIEHVGSWSDMARMAQHVRRLAPVYYVQTPNFWFPYEPHFRFLGFHWLPQQLQYRLLMRCNLGFGGRRQSVDAAMRGVQSTSMIDRRQLQTLFPDARIEHERVLGWTKSLMAIRDAG
jgi:hypothetical protein